MDRALALLAERGVRKAVKLAVSVPSHTPLMRDAARSLAAAIADVAWHPPACLRGAQRLMPPSRRGLGAQSSVRDV